MGGVLASSFFLYTEKNAELRKFMAWYLDDTSENDGLNCLSKLPPTKFIR